MASDEMTLPGIGRVVHYLEVHPWGGQVCRPALVVEVDEAQFEDEGAAVTLVIFRPYAIGFDVCDYREVDDLMPGSWHWPCLASGCAHQPVPAEHERLPRLNISVSIADEAVTVIPAQEADDTPG